MSGQSVPPLREQLDAVNEILAKNPGHAEMQRRRHELGVEILQAQADARQGITRPTPQWGEFRERPRMTATQIVVTWFAVVATLSLFGLAALISSDLPAVDSPTEPTLSAPVTEPTQPVPLDPTQPTLPAPTAEPTVAPPDDYWSQTACRRLGELTAEARAGLVTEDEAYDKLRDIHGDAANSENPTVANAIAEVLRLHTIGGGDPSTVGSELGTACTGK